ncbi:general amino acid permease [Leucogyrophana mollusca]|uniref:General amino acid permease n=1 Tax=Leucogyrophana mollusca TaxID=85980 RepID=A0ACB8BTN0_9AGAM|nr:general amino acid permease [Leucogyrophana mollusca]
MTSPHPSGDPEKLETSSQSTPDNLKNETYESEAFAYHGDRDNVQRRLGRQHIQMIALAGTIGTGLFLGLGEILALCGPLGSLIVYIHVGSVIYATLTSVGEMTAFAPISGSLIHYAARWLEPAVGFALGWNYFYYAAIAIPVEVTALSVLIGFWDANPDHTAIYIAVVVVLLFLINLFGVRMFGNSEIVFASLKIMLIVGLIIGGLVVSLGGGPDHERVAFRYWRDPGPMVSFLEPGARGRFVGLLVAIVPAAFSVSGIELIAITAGEAKQPRTNIVRAMRTVIFRLLFFYLLAVLVVGMLVPSNDPTLFGRASTAGQSPFVLAFTRAGIKVLPSIINAVLLTSAFSAANTFIFASSRILYGLAVQNQAPQFFTTCTKSGTPWISVITSGLFSLLAFMNVSSSAGVVFNWFVSLSTVCGLFGWLTINSTYLRYYYGLKHHGIVPQGIYRSPLQPYAAMWGIFWVLFYILVSGISVFWDFVASDFVAAYINIPIFIGLYIGFKVWRKTKIPSMAELDFTSNIPTLAETGDEDLLVEKPSALSRIRQII